MIKKVNKLFTGVSLFLYLGLLSTNAIGEEGIMYRSECSNRGDCPKEVHVPQRTNTIIEITSKGTFRMATGNEAVNSPAAVALLKKNDEGNIRQADQEETPVLKQIPLRFTQSKDPNSLGEVYAGLTEIKPSSQIFVGALHAFKRNIHTEFLAIETQKKLENLKIVLFQNTRSLSYLDLILFIPKDLDEEYLKTLLNSISQPELNKPWLSMQFGVMDTDTSTDTTTSQFSEGHIIMNRDEGLGAPYFNLSNNLGNFSSAASSGSLILNKDYEPLGVLQCLETISGEVSSRLKSEKLFRAISLNLDFNIVTPIYPLDLHQLITSMAQELILESNCKPVDKNGAGGL